MRLLGVEMGNEWMNKDITEIVWSGFMRLSPIFFGLGRLPYPSFQPRSALFTGNIKQHVMTSQRRHLFLFLYIGDYSNTENKGISRVFTVLSTIGYY